MNYQALQSELLAGHPDTGAYNADDQTAADELNAINRTLPKASMTGDEVFAATDTAEYNGLTDHDQDLWVSFTSKDIMNPYEQTNIDFIDHVFGVSSTTKSNLAGKRTNDVSRATEIADALDYFGLITVSHIKTARAI